MKKLIMLSLFLFVIINLGFVLGDEATIQECINEWEVKNLIPNNWDLKTGEVSYVPEIVFVGFKEGVSESEAENILNLYNLNWDDSFTFGHLINKLNYKILVESGAEYEWQCKLQEDSNIDFTELDMIFTGKTGGIKDNIFSQKYILITILILIILIILFLIFRKSFS